MEFEDMLDVGATTNKEVGKLSKRKVGVLTKASMNEVVDASAASGLTDGKRRGRKPRKQNEKEIMNEYMSEQEKHSAPTSAAGLRKYYENYQHMSHNEREQFDQKFTKPKTNSQEIYCSMLRAKSKKIILATGPAGTGKTLFATEFGVRNYLMGTYEKLIFTRPSVSVDEELGFLPGTMEEKMAPWVRPIYDVLYQFISPKEVQYLMEEKVIEIAPLGYMRGRTFKNCWIVADEMQNSTVSQMKMLLTRLGENSRLVITGDLEQFDRPNQMNGLEDFLGKFRGKRSSSIGSFEFDRSDIQREEVVKEILDIYGGDVPEYYVGTEAEGEGEGDGEGDAI
jgi:phosphate starvation-inducible PhoH-like protein